MQNNRCPICDSEDTSPLIDLGDQPPANELTDTLQSALSVRKSKLSLAICNSCLYVWLPEPVSGNDLFAQNTYLSGISTQTKSDLKELAEDSIRECKLKTSSVVLDIASNDGTLLENFVQKGMRIIGVDPSKPAYEIATAKGIPTINDFFTITVAKQIAKTVGYVDLITGANIITHVPDPIAFLNSCKDVLQKSGSIVLEFYYFESLLKNVAFDQIYHEHFSYFNLHTFIQVVAEAGLELYNARIVDAQGGSLRVFISFPNVKEINSSVHDILISEGSLRDMRTRYMVFSKQVAQRKMEIIDMMKKIKEQGKRIIGYGASAKATVLLNYLNLDTNSIICIGDNSQLKENKFIPGVGIPVVNPGRLLSTNPDLVIIFSWNLKLEILDFLNNLFNRRTLAVTFMPEIEFHEIVPKGSS